MISSRSVNRKTQTSIKDKNSHSSRSKSDKSSTHSPREPETINIEIAIQELINESAGKIESYEQKRQESLFELITNLEDAVGIKPKQFFKK
jgi:hypothetical protein